jgi:hypothetical protein
MIEGLSHITFLVSDLFELHTGTLERRLNSYRDLNSDRLQ